jgi:hypothetical protein
MGKDRSASFDSAACDAAHNRIKSFAFHHFPVKGRPVKKSLLLPLGIVALLLVAVASYFWATAAIDSLYAFRSPLKDNPPAPGEALGNPLTRRVVFVLIDGLRKDTADDSQVMPFLAKLRDQGASATIYSRPPSFSAPSYTVIFSGAWHDISDGPAVNLSYDEYWTWTQDNLFSAVHRAGGQTAISAYNWFEKLVPQDAVADHFYTPGEDRIADREVVDAALPWLRSGGHELVLIHLDQVDYAGHHEGGPVDPNWNAAATRVDDLLREITAELDLTQDTLLVTSDHGHLDRGGHGGHEEVLLREPLVLVGAGVKPGPLNGIGQQVDIAPTVAALLGANIPASAQGGVLPLLTLTPEQSETLRQARSAQQATLAAAYGEGIGRPVRDGETPDENWMQAARDQRLDAERVPRMIAALALFVLLVVFLWRTWSRTTLWGLVGVVAYLVVFNVRYALLSGRTYSLSSVLGANELIMYVALNTLLAFIVGWLVFAAGMRLFARPASEAAKLTVGFALLAVAITMLPALTSFAFNGPTITWILPDFRSFFLGFLGALQALFIAAFGILFAGIAALIAFALRSRTRRSPARTA